MASDRSARYKSKRKTSIRSQEQTFARMLPQLVRRYPGEFVALYRGQVVDHGVDDAQLARRLYDELGDVPFYIAKVQRGAPVYEIPSPEIDR